MSGTKHDQGKPDLTLLDRIAMEEVARVLMKGAEKYGRSNWRKGIEKERLLGAALRHIAASNDGELKDPEFSTSHLAHAICGLMFALHFEIKHEVTVADLVKITESAAELGKPYNFSQKPTNFIRLQVGKLYRNRSGGVVGPLTYNRDSLYEYSSGLCTYTAAGYYISGDKPNDFDLIEEVEE